MEGALVLLGFVAVSSIFFGRGVFPHPTRTYVGWGSDPAGFVWFLRWWPYAIGKGIDPLYTHLLWAPAGVSLTGATAIPGPAMVLAPVTLLAGPVVAYDVLAVLTPALSAWTGYLLCHHITGRRWPSVVGGYVFGFSAYGLGRVLGHPNLGLTFLLPLFVLVVLRRLEGRTSARAFVVAVAVLVAGQLLISPEVLLTFTIFGSVALAIAFATSPRTERRRLGSVVGSVAFGYLLAAIILSPFLVASVRTVLAHDPTYDFFPSYYSTDLLNLVAPTVLTVGGALTPVADRFTGNLAEQAGYLGIPLIAIVVAFGVGWRRTRASVVLLGTLAIVLVATLGPTLHIAGRASVWMPWRLVSSVPVLKDALPGRFMVYAFLIVAVIVAMWLAEPRAWPRSPWIRWGVAVLAVLSIAPNLSLQIWHNPVDTPTFFTDGSSARVLRPGENVLVVPYGDLGNSMMWQAQAGMTFRMAGGYVNAVPPEAFSAWPILSRLYDGPATGDDDAQLRAFLHAHDVGAVIVKDGYPGPWASLFGPLDRHPLRAGGVTVYRVPGTAR